MKFYQPVLLAGGVALGSSVLAQEPYNPWAHTPVAPIPASVLATVPATVPPSTPASTPSLPPFLAPVSISPSAPIIIPPSVSPSAPPSIPASAPVVVPSTTLVAPESVSPVLVSVPTAVPAVVSAPASKGVPSSPIISSPRSLETRTLENDGVAGRVAQEHRHTLGDTTGMFGRGAYAGTMIQSNVGQENVAGVHAVNGFQLVLDHTRLTNKPDILQGGFRTPEFKGIILQTSAELPTDQQYGNINGQILFKPVTNTQVRSGTLHFFGENYGIVGGQYVGPRLGGFIVNGDIIGNTNTLGTEGFIGFESSPWYVSAGGNSTRRLITSSQGVYQRDRKFGVLNQAWYSRNAQQGFKVIMGPEFTLDGNDAADLDQRLTNAGQLWVNEGWQRFDPNYANGRFLIGLNADRNEKIDEWHIGGMFYDQMSKDGTGVENYFWGVGFARAQAKDCKGWVIVLDEASPFPLFSERVTLRVDEEYHVIATAWIGTLAR